MGPLDAPPRPRPPLHFHGMAALGDLLPHTCPSSSDGPRQPSPDGRGAVFYTGCERNRTCKGLWRIRHACGRRACGRYGALAGFTRTGCCLQPYQHARRLAAGLVILRFGKTLPPAVLADSALALPAAPARAFRPAWAGAVRGACQDACNSPPPPHAWRLASPFAGGRAFALPAFSQHGGVTRVGYTFARRRTRAFFRTFPPTYRALTRTPPPLTTTTCYYGGLTPTCLHRTTTLHTTLPCAPTHHLLLRYHHHLPGRRAPASTPHLPTTLPSL